MRLSITPTLHERKLGDNDFIVSKTDPSGRITYANRIFMKHNIIRHPDMPRGVFRFMWNTLKAGDEFFGFAKNICSDGGFYWVFANITPDYDKNGRLKGYYSVRRKPPESALNVLIPVYKEMLAIEQRSPTKKEAPDKSIAYLVDVVTSSGASSYNKLVLDLFKPNGI